MNTFFDSSSFAKRYVEEGGSAEVDDICRVTDRLAICSLCVPEIISALNRRVREKEIRKTDYPTIKGRLLLEVRDIEVVHLTDEVIAVSTLLLEQNVLRAMDALHVACAHAWRSDLFVTSDNRQWKAAVRLGLKSRLII